MQNKRKFQLLIFWAIIIFFVSSCRDNENEGELKIGGKAPNFKAVTLEKETFELQDLTNQIVLLDFWGSWCAPCRKEHPEMVKMIKEFEDKTFKNAASFEIISVAMELDSLAWKKAIQKDNLFWPYQVMEHTDDLSKVKVPIAATYRIEEVPSRFLINEKGMIVGINPSLEAVRTYLKTK